MSTIVKKCSFPICSSNVSTNHVCNSHDILTEAPDERSLKAWYCADCFSCMRNNVKKCEYCNHLKDEILGWARRRTVSPDYLPLC
ncbi:hypothetical protein RB653_000139 [Dictyostelium firmibasis]|uniref:Uncharacterized protein n=1 Tax=Dictyostelium firmibasis TaxID=79012 RepID=A0AAN7YU42_9MYCE